MQIIIAIIVIIIKFWSHCMPQFQFASLLIIKTIHDNNIFHSMKTMCLNFEKKTKKKGKIVHVSFSPAGLQ